MDIRSMFILFTSSGILPTACAASVWKNTFLLLHNAPISATGCFTPISLLTVIMDTRDVSGVIALSSSSMLINPLGCTGR
uniref:Putative secreted protein n=1 Tax=Anopheles darlingi TaxID=43151 RepID=A0A2M4DJ56_ANODA